MRRQCEESTAIRLQQQCHNEKRAFSCNKCDKTFTQKPALQQHSVSHSEDRPFECSTCGKRFKWRHHLQDHFAVHSEEKPWVCKICGKACKQRSNLLKHLITHSKDKPFSCHKCGKSFKQSSILKLHSSSCCGETFVEENFPPKCSSIPAKQRLLNCHQCGAIFAQKRELRAHTICHNNEHQLQITSVIELQHSQRRDLDVQEVHNENLLTSVYMPSASYLTSAKTKKEYLDTVACPACHNVFDQHDSLIRHANKCEKYALILKKEKAIVRQHPEMREYKCGFCHLPFIRATFLKEHLKDAHGVDFVLHWCDKYGCKNRSGPHFQF